MNQRGVRLFGWVILVIVLAFPLMNRVSATDLTITGQVVDADRRPVDRISIQVYDSSGQLRRAAFTDQHGYFTADRLSPGNYDLAVASISQELARKKSVPAGTHDLAFVVSLASVRGVVCAPSRQGPLKPITVTATSIDWAMERSVQVVGNGEVPFELLQLPPSIIELAASTPGFRDAVARLDLSKPQSSQVVLKFAPLCQVAILVLDSTSKTPLSKVSVNIIEMRAGTPQYRLIGETDESGTLVDRQAQPGTITVMAANPLHESVKVDVVAHPSRPTRATLCLDRGSRILVNFSDPATVDRKASNIYAKPIGRLPSGDIGGYAGHFQGEAFSIPVPAGEYEVHTQVIRSGPVKPRSLTGAPPSNEQRVHRVSVGRKQTVTVNL